VSDVGQTENLEALLGSGGQVRLGRRDAQDILQKLRARGAVSEAADRLETGLAHADEVVLAPDEAHALLDELRASGRRWVFGSEAPREHAPPRAREPERRPEPEPARRRGLRRLWRR
jgi:hypothetical protein